MRRGGSLDYFLAGVFLVVIFWKPVPALTAGPVSLVPINCCDGLYEVAQVQGEQVWQNLADSDYLYVDIPNDPDFVPGMPVYVQVIYYDTGYGTIELHYDSTRGDDLPSMYFRSETHTRSSRVDTGGFAVSYHELALPALSGRQNGGADFRLSLLDGNGVPNAVKSVVVQRAPFDDPGFQTALSRPWLKPYAGPTRDDVDATTLRGKLMVGYQGWFRAPNDTADSGRFLSWCHDEGTMAADNLAVDQWPDLTGFEDGELFPAGSILTGSGQPARVFSSTTRETVRRHFHWMRKYNIDGVFLERFVHPERSGAWGHEEWVLHHVREAANLEGRLWAIEYDVSALEGRPDSLDIIRSDWQWLVDVVRILDDPRYAHEGEQPVVFVWGLPFPDRGFDVATADAIVEYLKNDPTYGGNYVIGGVRSDWRTNPIFQPWFEHFQRYDALSSWMPDDADYLDDALQLASWSMDYFPHAHPGFSWANLQKEPAGTSALVPREGGNFFWDKLCHAVASNSGRLVVGMFDEYNEGTAIMPMSDDPPDPPAEWGRFITNEGRPSDWWMLLAGEGRAMLLGQRPADDPLPEASQLANRSNTGAEIFADLGSEDRGFGLLPVPVADGNTSAVTFGGRDCRVNTTAGTDLYFYFNVDAAFAAEEAQGLDVTIEVEYLDEGGDVDFSLEYDGLSGPYTSHAKKVVTSGSNLWTTVRFEIADAFFGGRQNSGADFRLVLDVTRSAQLHIDRIRVLRDDEPEGWTQNRNPDLPATPNPADNAADSGTDPRLSWTGGDPDTGDTTTYDVYFGTDAAPPLVRSGYGAQDYDPGPLELGTIYFWRIVASDAHGAQTVGPLWTFTTVSAFSGQNGGSNASSELWIKAILQVPGAPVILKWNMVGADLTPSGDQVISGYFYADPNDFAYGSPYNPEVFVKIYIAASCWCNIAFNHVTVDPVTVYSAHHYAGAAQQSSSATLESRLVQHEYTGVAIDTSKQSTGGSSGSAGALGYTLGSDLWSKAVLQVAGNPVTLIWKEVGTDTTPSGAKVISGYFYADPATFAYGSAYNPEVFVKVYIDPTGWANMAFNHVTVDPVSIDSTHGYAGTADQSGTVTLNGRLLEHTYTGVSTQ